MQSPLPIISPDIFHWIHQENNQIQINSIFAEDLFTKHVHSFNLVQPCYNLQPWIDGDNLNLLTSHHLYSFQINASTSNAGSEASPPLSHIISYPNPASTAQGFRLETPIKQPFEIGIYNIKGQLLCSVFTDPFGGYEVKAEDLKGLNTGIYFLKAHAAKHLKARKFILVK